MLKRFPPPLVDRCRMEVATGHPVTPAVSMLWTGSPQGEMPQLVLLSVPIPSTVLGKQWCHTGPGLFWGSGILCALCIDGCGQARTRPELETQHQPRPVLVCLTGQSEIPSPSPAAPSTLGSTPLLSHALCVCLLSHLKVNFARICVCTEEASLSRRQGPGIHTGHPSPTSPGYRRHPTRQPTGRQGGDGQCLTRDSTHQLGEAGLAGMKQPWSWAQHHREGHPAWALRVLRCTHKPQPPCIQGSLWLPLLWGSGPEEAMSWPGTCPEPHPSCHVPWWRFTAVSFGRDVQGHPLMVGCLPSRALPCTGRQEVVTSHLCVPG